MVIQKKSEILCDTSFINNHFNEIISDNNINNINKLNNNIINNSNNVMLESSNNNNLISAKTAAPEFYSLQYIQHINDLKKEAFKDLQVQLQRENYSWWKKQFYIENIKKDKEEEKTEDSSILLNEKNEGYKKMDHSIFLNSFQRSTSFSSDSGSSSSEETGSLNNLMKEKHKTIINKKKFHAKNNKNKDYPNNKSFKSIEHSCNNSYDESPSIYEGKRERKNDMNDEYLYINSKRNKYNQKNNNINRSSSNNNISKYYSNSNNKTHSYKNSTLIKERVNNNFSIKKNENNRNLYSYLNCNQKYFSSNLFIRKDSIPNTNKRTSNDFNFYFKNEKDLSKNSPLLNIHIANNNYKCKSDSNNELDNDNNELKNSEISNFKIKNYNQEKNDDKTDEEEEEEDEEEDEVEEQEQNELNEESDVDDDAISIKLYSSSYHDDNNLLFINKNNKEKMKIDRDGNITENSFSQESIQLDSNGNTPNGSNLLTSSLLSKQSSDCKKLDENNRDDGDRELSSLSQLCKTMSVSDYSEVLDYEENLVSFFFFFFFFFLLLKKTIY